MEDNLIMEYFFWMDKIYNLKSPEGVEDYIRDMKKRISQQSLSVDERIRNNKNGYWHIKRHGAIDG